jgi:alanine racemase
VARFGVHVKIDTGMTRLGVVAGEFGDFLARCAAQPSIRVDGLATHFAGADDGEPEETEAQLRRFVGCLEEARRMGADPQVIHAANSAAALRFPASRFDLVRPGLLLYGARPGPRVPDLGLTPALTVATRVIALRRVPAGTRVSYGGTRRLDRPSVVATLPLGYADGYPRSLSNAAQILIRGRRAPVVGVVCMDLCMVDVTDVPMAAVGDEAVVLGGEGAERILPEEVAAWAGTISYEILTGVSRRVPRRYDGKEEAG